MTKRCIMIFPKFDNMPVIDKIRQQYDPLAAHVDPHVTLVFPFDSELSTEALHIHLYSVLSDCKPFPMTLQGIVPSRGFGNYLFLQLQEGYEQVVELHKALYTGILAEYYPSWLHASDFIPHMTVGNLQNEAAFETALNQVSGLQETFTTMVSEITVEIIDENEDSLIELRIPLNTQSQA